MSKLLVKTPIGEFERIEDLVYYDQPIIFTVKREEELFLSFFVDYDEETNIDMYLFVPVSENRLQDLKEGKLSCRQAIQNAEQGFVYKMYLSCDEERPSTTGKVECRLIDNDWLPSEESFLKKNDNEVKEQNLRPELSNREQAEKNLQDFLKLKEEMTKTASDYGITFEEYVELMDLSKGNYAHFERILPVYQLRSGKAKVHKLDRDYILESLKKMRTEYECLNLEFEVQEKVIEINELIKELEENTEKGVSFRQDIFELILNYMSKFKL